MRSRKFKRKIARDLRSVSKGENGMTDSTYVMSVREVDEVEVGKTQGWKKKKDKESAARNTRKENAQPKEKRQPRKDIALRERGCTCVGLYALGLMIVPQSLQTTRTPMVCVAASV